MDERGVREIACYTDQQGIATTLCDKIVLAAILVNMKIPAKLYRYRPLQDSLLDRELDALKQSYLYAPSFSAMNDPMEAFYETGGPGDRIIDAMLAPTGKCVNGMYSILSEMIDRCALVSLAGSYEYLPMWAYYGSNFAGMCLEFATSELDIGDFQNEQLRPVKYARSALPSLTLSDMASEHVEEAVVARITRKRIEWAHEKEWRFVTGETGPKHYLDDALTRVFLGPRCDPQHVEQVCAVLDRRPTEVLQGEIMGFDLVFRTIKPARPLDECERVGGGHFNPADIISDPKELENFLKVPLDELLSVCAEMTRRPNLEQIADFSVSGRKNALFIWFIYRLRSGRDVYDRRYFDSRLRPLPKSG